MITSILGVITSILMFAYAVNLLLELRQSNQEWRKLSEESSELAFDRDVLDRTAKFLNQIHIYRDNRPNHDDTTINKAIQNHLQTKGYQLKDHTISRNGQNHAHIIYYTDHTTQPHTPTQSSS